ncbi:MAG TPA: aldehyde dehydrogenase (NADP(+)) [Candidatus Ruania gallistercoris]|uniref:Aldehyde dehydrogenase (NADP(+)) n=1 Tax=Candidatus Ruania gallistercoris TaxID=2838746 RepID=A0A9D2EGW1_9MICO|nr:aldehyde dehydrogenase (NADP(+)) [Candidatus Ruania gallistercoris]
MGTTPAELDGIVQAAHTAQQTAADATPEVRAGWLSAIADQLDDAAEELVPLAREETHLPEQRLRGELARTTFQLRLLGEEITAGHQLEATIDHADPDWGMGPRPDLRRVNVPLGVVGVFGASNFPFAFSVMGGDSASALAAGCAVVHKIHEAHQRLGERTAELVRTALAGASAPTDLFAAVTGQDAGGALVDHPLVRAIGFTGSTRVGTLLSERAAARPEPIPFYGELGSTNPVFVTPAAWSARAEEILTGYAGSLTLGMGQFCTNPGLLFVPEFDQAAQERLEQALATAPQFEMLSPRLAEGYADAVRSVAAAPGVHTLVDGAAGLAPAPTVLSTDAETVRAKPELLSTEMFGPAGLVIHYRNEDELPELARLLEGQLTATVHAEPDDQTGALVHLLTTKAGRVLWNGWPTGVTVSYAQQHGGPFPATTAATTTSVGTAAVRRFLRPVAFQDFPGQALPPALREDNPWGIARRVDGQWEYR